MLGAVGTTCALIALGLGATAASAQLAPEPSPSAERRFGDGGTSAFYLPPPGPAEAGRMIRTEPLLGPMSPSRAAEAARILYWSRSGVGAEGDVAVSGQVLFPAGEPPTGGWPVVAWAHGTTGVADVCAPSWRGYSKRDKAYLDRWLDEGFAVVATDYEGLGTPGPHPYLIPRSEGRSVLDGVRAALGRYPGRLRNDVVIVGQSQGSGAALGAAWLAPRYAPEVHAVAVVATGLVVTFAPRAGAGHLPLPVTYDDPRHMDAAYAMLRVEGTDQSLHPDMDPRMAMTAAGVELSRTARAACLIDLFKAAKLAGASGGELFTPALSSLEEGEPDASAIPGAALGPPVFAGTGLADDEASLPGQYDAVAAMCDAGSTVVWRRYPGLTHNGTVNASLVDSVPFARAALGGTLPKAACGPLVVPGPVEAPTPGVPFND